MATLSARMPGAFGQMLSVFARILLICMKHRHPQGVKKGVFSVETDYSPECYQYSGRCVKHSRGCWWYPFG